jgi:hypothetical protein
MPIVFVHGITVRKDRFQGLLDAVSRGFHVTQPHLPIVGFYWGDMASALRYGGASIPGFLEGARAAEVAEGPMTDARQILMLLVDDPYLELRLLKDKEEFDPTGAGFIPSPPEVGVRNQALEAARHAVAQTLATAQGLLVAAGKSIAARRWQELVKEAFDSAGKTARSLTIVDLIDPLSRCLTAAAYREVEAGQKALDTGFRWKDAEAIVQQIFEQKLGGQRGWLGDKIKGLASGAAAHAVTFAMRHGLRRRIMDSIAIFVGDILAYTAKREEIQKVLDMTVAQAVANSSTPLWMIGHSLGGILCFDYCLTANRKVERLITVGSQVGLFAELGAFPTLTANAQGKLQTPASVTTWINMYDPDDILSFLAAPVMTNAIDIEYDTDSPFPISHSEYWNQQKVYEKLVQ